MALQSALRGVTQALFCRRNATNDLSPRSSYVTATLAYLAAALLIAATCAQSTQYGWETGSARSETHGLIMAAAALGAALAAPLSWLAASRCFARWQLGRALVAVALGTGCLIFGTLASLGFLTTTRDAIQAQRGAGADQYRNASRQHAAAVRELESLLPARSVRELQALIDGVLADPRSDCGIRAKPDTELEGSRTATR